MFVLHDGFVTAVRADGSDLIYSTYLGGRGDDLCQGIAVDREANAYVTGYTESDDFPTMNAYQREFTASLTKSGSDHFYDAFMTKLDSAGARLRYSTYLGGADNDLGYAIAADNAGFAYITGEVVSLTTAHGFPVTSDAYQRTPHGYRNAFVTKLNTNFPGPASLVYSTYLGGGGLDIARGITVFCGNTYLTGQTTSPDFPIVERDSPTTTFAGGLGDAFLAEFDDSLSPCAHSPFSKIREVFFACPGNDCIVDPITGAAVNPRDFFNIDRWCPICLFAVVADVKVVNGAVRDITLSEEGLLKGLVIDNGKLRAFDIEGNETPLQLSVQTGKESGAFTGCPGCQKVLKAGGVIRGLVIEKGRLRALIIDSQGKGVPSQKAAFQPTPAQRRSWARNKI
jgi:hypothetical protein